MVAGQGDHYGPLLERLQLPHPLIQRFAVNAIFERVKSGPSHTGLQSSAGQEAITRCLTSTQAAVIDQTVKEICKLCADGAVSVERGMQDLQAALDAVNSESVGGVMNGIAFLCRLFLRKVTPGVVFIGKSGDVVGVGFHPLVKSFQSRPEELQQHILQHVGTLLVKASPEQQTIALEFLHPFMAVILLQPWSSPNHVYFARNLHSQLCLLSCQLHSHVLLETLIHYVSLYSTDTPQGREFVVGSLRELTDVWENLVTLSRTQQMKVKEMEGLGSQLLFALVGFCHRLLSLKASLYPALVLVKRMLKSLKLLSPALLDSIRVNMVALAHMLAMVDLEQEQLLLIDLGLEWVRDIHAKAMTLPNNTSSPGIMILVWVFPALHVMSYPSVSVKNSAASLLQALERVVAAILRYEKNDRALEGNFWTKGSVSWSDQHLAVEVCCLLQMQAEDESASNWISNMMEPIKTRETSAEQWLRCLASFLNKCSPCGSTADRTLYPLKLSRGILVSICTLVTVFLLHPSIEVALSAAESLASIAKVEPLWGMSLLPVGLFCIRFQGQLGSHASSDVQLGILKVFPSLACHSTTLPLVIQVLKPMLDSKSNMVVQATAIRLLCKTWEFTDRAFPHLQKVLQPQDMKGDFMQTQLCRSRAACIRDVSKKDPDRGIDLVLSIQACIESKDPVVLSLGLQSLAFLCKEDVIDFYTAWLVLSNNFQTLPTEPQVLKSLCMLLRYGALDAAAYPEAAAGVLEILWKAATKKESLQMDDMYSGVRAVAFEALASYKVDDLEALCPDDKGKEVDLLFSETSVIVLPFLEELLNTALVHEHRERQRGRREVKLTDNKLRRLLKAFPETLNSTGFAPLSDFAGAALLCFSLPSPEKTERISKAELQKRLKTWQANHEKLFLEAADQLHLGRNLVMAVLSLQSWCSFISRWLHTMFIIYESENPKIEYQENILRAARYLSKIIQESCEAGIPRVGESATLALAALCKVMPTQAHGISQKVSVFLEMRLLQEGHEHMQWSAALALGWVSTCLHPTDWQRKHKIAELLLKNAGRSDSGIVRGACGLALGVICQSLLRQEDSSPSAGATRQRETELLLHIVLSLIQLTSETSPIAAPALRKVLGLLKTEVLSKERFVITHPLSQKGSMMEEEKFWAVVGLVWGLGSCVPGLQQLHCPTLLSALTDLMLSWVSGASKYENEEIDYNDYSKQGKDSELFLAAGACLVLSICVEVSARLEILTVGANVVLQRVLSLIIYSTDPTMSTEMEHWRSSLFCALYIGAGNLLASLLQDGAQSIRLELIQSTLRSMQAGTENADHGGWSQLGAMIGIANSLGAGAALLGPSKRGQQLADLHMLSRVQVGSLEQSAISRPLLHEAVCEGYVSFILQKLLEVVRNEQNCRLKSYAGWALAFTHNGFFGGGELEEHRRMSFEEFSSTEAHLVPREAGYPMRSLQDLPEESTLRLLCTKFVSQEQINSMLPTTVASVFRCLQKAPRLPALDWSGLTRRLLRQNQSSSNCTEDDYNAGIHNGAQRKFNTDQKEARQQCFLFAISHAEQIPALAIFLDELSELSRLGTLESSLRNLIPTHIFKLQKIFSPLRLKQLIRDVQELAVKPTGFADFLAGDTTDFGLERCSFRVSLWKGLAAFFEDSNFGQQEGADEVLSCVEDCMSVLINVLPTSMWTEHQINKYYKPDLVSEEWSAAVITLARAPKAWLLHALKVPLSDILETKETMDMVSRAVFARCQLVGTGCLHVSELKTCRRWLMGQKSSGMVRLLIEGAWATREASLEEKQQWLLDSLDIALVSPFPTTVVLFTALLTSCWCSTAPLLPLNPIFSVQNLSLSFPSLLSDPGWDSIVESVAHKLSLILNKLGDALNNDSQGWETIQVLNRQVSLPKLLSVLRRTCIELKDYLSQNDKFNLAKLIFTGIKNRTDDGSTTVMYLK